MGVYTWICLILALIAEIVRSQDNIQIVGHDVRSHLDYDGPLVADRRVYLLGHVFFERGVLFGYISHMKRIVPIHFQIWRPIDGTDRQYRLISDFIYTPKLGELNKRTAIYISSNCPEIEPGDSLGFMDASDQSSIGYLEDLNTDRQYLVYDYGTTEPSENQTKTFGTESMPYDFALSAVYDTDFSWYEQNPDRCRPGLTIPGESDKRPVLPPAPPGTNKVIVTGSRIPETTRYQGPADLGRNIYVVSTFTTDGVLFAIMAYFTASLPVRFQIWRPIGDPTDLLYHLVYETRYTPHQRGLHRRIQIPLQPGSDCPRIKAGDRLAFMNEDYTSSIGYSLSSHTAEYLFSGTDHGFPSINSTKQFLSIPLPFKFAFGVAYDSDITYYDENGDKCRPGLRLPPAPTDIPTGSTTPSTQVGPRGPPGVKGPKGDKGNTGDKGLEGDQGLPGLKGDQGMDGARGRIYNTTEIINAVQLRIDQDCSCGTGLLTTTLVLVLIIWLLVLTLLILITLFVLTRVRREDMLLAELYQQSAKWQQNNEDDFNNDLKDLNLDD